MPHVTKIFGGPGAGKTTQLVELIKAELQNGVKASRIGFISHTTAAAKEAWERIKAITDIAHKPRYFCTIHSACMSMTGIKRAEVFQEWDELFCRSGFVFTGNMTDAGDEYGINKIDPLMNGNHVLILDNYAKANMISIDEALQRVPPYPVLRERERIDYVLEVLKEYKQEIGKYTFDDMLTTYNDDPDPPSLPVDVIFVDEAQDLSKLQWSIVHKFWKDCKRVYIVGDDDQSIYDFLGSDPTGFLDHPADEVKILEKSFRCPQEIGELADRIIGRVSRRQEKEFKWRTDVQGEVVYASWPLIETMMKPYDGTTMLLHRHTLHCKQTQQLLKTLNLAYSVNGESIYNDNHAMKLKEFLRLWKGEELSLRDAAFGLSLVKGMEENVWVMRTAARTDKERTTNRDKLTWVNWDAPWWVTASKGFGKLESLNLKLRLALNENGLEVLGSIPPISVSTMHSSKGREADRVIIITDCLKCTHDDTMYNPDNALRLAYVAVTRAKKQLIIHQPRQQAFVMRDFFL